MRRLIPRSIFGLVALAGLVLTGTTLLLGAHILEIVHESVERQLVSRIQTETAALLSIFDTEGIEDLRGAIERRNTGSDADGMHYLLVDHDGRRLAGQVSAEVPQPGWTEYLRVDTEFGPRESQSLTTAIGAGARLLVAADRQPVDEMDEILTHLVSAAVISMLIVGFACAWGLGAITQRRLNRINATAQAIIDGDHARRIPRDGTAGEFDRLAGTLNRMLDRIAELLDNVRHVSSDIAHDLRTPLARQLQVLDDALTHGKDAESYRRAIVTATESGREMQGLFAALLRISEIETFDIRSAFREIELAEVIERVADAFRPDLEAAGHSLTVVVAAQCRMPGDRHLLSQMVANLVENAMRHTPTGTTVTLRLTREEGSVLLVVADDGPGIAPGDRERVLRRFARLEKSRTTPGFGIGLTLAASIARAHFAELTLADNRPGLQVKIRFALKVSTNATTNETVSP